MIHTLEQSAVHNSAELSAPEPETSGLAVGFFESLKNPLERLRSWHHHQSFQLWDSRSYFLPDPNLSLLQREQRLETDLRPFLEEYVGMFSKKIYPYSIYGIIDGYDIPVTQICRNNEAYLTHLGKETPRAKLETWVAEVGEYFLEHPDLGLTHSLVTFSPAGEKSENYPGTKPENYSFINVFQKTGNGWMLIQYTSYDSLSDLTALNQELLHSLGGTPFIDQQPHQLPTLPASERHTLIAQPILLPNKSLPALENRVFSNQQNWPVPLSKLPEVDPARFHSIVSEIVKQSHAVLADLLDEEPETAATFFDLFITIARETFLKWVEENASNYQSLGAVQRKKHQSAFATQSVLELITAKYELKSKVLTKKASKAEKRRLKKLEHSTRLRRDLPLRELSQAAHCVIMSPASSARQQLAEMAKQAAKGGEGKLRLQIESVSRRYSPLVFTDPETGETQTWYVMNQYVSAYKDSCYFKDQVVYGPCDIPLSADNLVLSEAAYLAELEAEKQLKRRSLLANSLANAGATETDSLETQLLIEELDHQLQKLMYKEFLGLEEFFTGDILKPAEELFGVYGEIAKYLSQVNNPMDALKSLVVQLSAGLTVQSSSTPALTNPDATGIIVPYGGHPNHHQRFVHPASLAQTVEYS